MGSFGWKRGCACVPRNQVRATPDRQWPSNTILQVILPALQSNVRIRTVNNPLSRASLGCSFDVARVRVPPYSENLHYPYVLSSFDREFDRVSYHQFPNTMNKILFPLLYFQPGSFDYSTNFICSRQERFKHLHRFVSWRFYKTY